MTRKQYYVALAVLAVAGLAGGALASWLAPGKAAWAQEEAVGVLTARKFRLVDDEGKERAVLGMFQSAVYPRTGERLANVSGLRLYDTLGNKRAALTLYEDGRPGLSLFDATGKPRIGLCLLDDGSAYLSVLDPAGTTRAMIGVREDGGPWLALFDAAEEPPRDRHPRVIVSLLSDFSSPLMLLNAAGDVIWQAP